jgi:putative ATP-dependent endonuclease of the OLD family
MTNELLEATDVSFSDFDPTSPSGEESTEARLTIIKSLLKDFRHPLMGKTFSRLLADRDIRQEQASKALDLREDGAGATNIIRRFITTSNPAFPRELVQTDLLRALNTVFGSDGQFTEIQVKNHDEQDSPGEWEIYLGESRKGLVPLSNSGSGLKTVFLVLLNLLVLPKLLGVGKANFCFAFEELENNIHPSLLRRLL